jgi:hypothetical protein
MLNMKLFTVAEFLYAWKIPTDFTDLTPDRYKSLEGLNWSSILEVALRQTLGEESKGVLVNAFIRETLVYPVEGSTIGSADMHTNFQAWLRRSLGGVQEKGGADAILAQFPIAEFSRLMKAAGFDMTRRSRGMVYLNVAQKGSSGKAPEYTAEDEVALAEEAANIAKILADAERDRGNAPEETEESLAEEAANIAKIFAKSERNPVVDTVYNTFTRQNCVPEALFDASVETYMKKRQNMNLEPEFLKSEIVKVAASTELLPGFDARYL